MTPPLAIYFEGFNAFRDDLDVLIAHDRCREHVKGIVRYLPKLPDTDARDRRSYYGGVEGLTKELNYVSEELRDLRMLYPEEAGLTLALQVIDGWIDAVDSATGSCLYTWTEPVEGADAWNAFIARHFAQ